ncbi:MAG: signal peptidase I [Bdellovibrionales bacterium]
MSAPSSHSPWLIALASFFLGPLAGMLRLGKVKVGLLYFFGTAAAAITAFVVAHFGFSPFDPRQIALYAIGAITLIGAAHCFWTAKKEPQRMVKWHGSWLFILALCFVLPIGTALAVRTFVVEPFHTASRSMEPTLKKETYFSAIKYAYGQESKPQPGDIILFNVRRAGKQLAYVKRVIAVGGDTIGIDCNGLSLNGHGLPRQKTGASEADQTLYAETLPNGKKIVVAYDKVRPCPVNAQSYTVPKGHYFVLGDNRSQSLDSSTGLGLVPFEAILGRASRLFWNEKTYRFSYTPIE